MKYTDKEMLWKLTFVVFLVGMLIFAYIKSMS